MINLIPVQTEEHKQQVKTLFLEYIEFVRQNLVREFEIDFKATDVAPYIEEDVKKLDKLLPPKDSCCWPRWMGKLPGWAGCARLVKGWGRSNECISGSISKARTVTQIAGSVDR